MNEATIEFLLADEPGGDGDGPVEESGSDAATTVSQLEESELLDVRLDLVRNIAGLIFDLRVNPLSAIANTAVVVARGIKSLTWGAGWARESRWSWEVANASTRAAEGLVDLRVEMQPQGALRLECLRLDVHLVSVPDVPEAPPNYLEADEAALRAGQPRWDSAFRLIARTTLGTTQDISSQRSPSDPL